MYKQVITIFILLASLMLDAQCWTNTVPYNTSFNWMTSGINYPVYYTNGQASPSNTIELPFYADQSNINNGNDNLTELHGLGTNLDIKPADGWVLISKDFGTQNGAGNTSPHLMLYNKFTGRVRFFFGITGTLAGNYAYLRTFFEDNGSSTRIKTALLNFNTPIVKTLKYFNPDMDVNTINQHSWQSQLGNEVFWYYSDFMTAYDPCACMISNNTNNAHSILNFKQTNYTVSKINADINGTINQVVDGSTLTSANAGGSRVTFGGLLSSSIKGYQTFDEYKNKFNSVYDKMHQSYKDKVTKDFFYSELAPFAKQGGWKQWEIDAEFNKFRNSPDGFKKFAGVSKLDNFSNTFGFLKGVASFVPYVGAAMGLIDAFFGGDGGTSPPPAPMNFDVNLKLTGEISTSTNTGGKKLRNPGVITSFSGTYNPIYDNVLGVLNMLEPPLFEYAEIKPVGMTRLSNDNLPCVLYPQGILSGYAQNVVMKNNMYQYRIVNAAKMVVNPQSELEIESVDASIVIEYKRSDLLSLKNNSQSKINCKGENLFIGGKFMNDHNGCYDYQTTKTYQNMKKIPFYPQVFSTDNLDSIIKYIEAQKEFELEYLDKHFDTAIYTGKIRFRTPYVPLQCLNKLNFTLFGNGSVPNTYTKVIVKLKHKTDPTKIYTQILTFDATNHLVDATKLTSVNGTYTPVVYGTNCWQTAVWVPLLGPMCISSGCNDMNYEDFQNVVKPFVNPLSNIIDGTVNPVQINNSSNNIIYVKGNALITSNLIGKTIYATGAIEIANGVILTNCYTKAFQVRPVLGGAYTASSSTFDPIPANINDFINCNSLVSDIVATENDLYSTNATKLGICNQNKYKENAGYLRSTIVKDFKDFSRINNTTSSISLHPNPTSSKTTITLSGYENTSVSVMIFDLVGREVYTQLEKDITAREHQAVLNTETLQAGTYIVKVFNDTEEKIAKLIILKN